MPPRQGRFRPPDLILGGRVDGTRRLPPCASTTMGIMTRSRHSPRSPLVPLSLRNKPRSPQLGTQYVSTTERRASQVSSSILVHPSRVSKQTIQCRRRAACQPTRQTSSGRHRQPLAPIIILPEPHRQSGSGGPRTPLADITPPVSATASCSSSTTSRRVPLSPITDHILGHEFGHDAGAPMTHEGGRPYVRGLTGLVCA